MASSQPAPTSKHSDDDIYRVPDDLLETKAGAPPSFPTANGYRARKAAANKRRWLIIAGVVVVVLALGGGVAALLINQKLKGTNPAKSTTTTTSTSQSSSSAGSQNTQSTADASMKTYTSQESALNLSFQYPANWQVAPATTTSGGTSNITVDTTPFTLATAAGTTTTAKATITLRPGSAGISELGSGSPTVAQDSVQIAYSRPAADQHQYPYITFIHLPKGSTVAGSFEEVMITGISQFKKGDTITADTLSGLDPVVSVAFYGCPPSGACTATGTGALSVTNDAWTNNGTLQSVLTVLKSLQLN